MGIWRLRWTGSGLRGGIFTVTKLSDICQSVVIRKILIPIISNFIHQLRERRPHSSQRLLSWCGIYYDSVRCPSLPQRRRTKFTDVLREIVAKMRRINRSRSPPLGGNHFQDGLGLHFANRGCPWCSLPQRERREYGIGNLIRIFGSHRKEWADRFSDDV